MASIDSPEGRPRVRWRDPDGTAHARTFNTKRAAEDFKREVEDCTAAGRRWEPRDARPRARLREVSAAWLTDRSRTLKPRTVVNLGQHIEAFVAWMEGQHGARVTLAAMSRATLSTYWTVLLSAPLGRHLHSRTPTTAAKHIQAVQSFWSWAANDGGYPECPAPRTIDLPARVVTPRPAPTWGEMDAAIREAQGWRRNLVIVMRCTGLRVQQAMGLRWTDVDWPARRLHVRGELGKMRQERAGRWVPVAPPLLEEWGVGELATWDRGAPWIVPCPLPHRIVRSRDIERIWLRTGAREATWTGRPDHAFRAGFQSCLREAGASRDATEYLVGHAMPGVDASYIDPERSLRLTEAVAMVPPFALSAIRLAVGGG